MLWIATGITDQVLYFDAGELGLSSFTVYRARNGAAAVAMTTPTIAEVDATNMPGIYTLLLDEDMTIGTGNSTESMLFFITHTGIAPIIERIVLFDPLAFAGFTSQMTESYAADGIAPTPAQALFMIQQMLTEHAISGVTWTVKKLDGSTVAATFTLDDAGTPTSVTRAT